MTTVPLSNSASSDSLKSEELDTRQTKINLKDLSPSQITELLVQLGERPYRGSQIAAWLFNRGCLDFEDMTDISKSSKIKMAKYFSVSPLLNLVKDEADPEGARRLLWRLKDDLLVESVLLTEASHYTLCLSTQVGCRMGCRFCRTGSLGLSRNLTQGEIIDQIILTRQLIAQDEKDEFQLTNLVFMGMGEPLDNADNVLNSLDLINSPKYLAMSSKHISLSTVGLIPQIKRLSELGGLKGGLTISLGSANDELRSQLMPINKKWPLSNLKEALADFPLPKGRRLTFAYVLLEGLNDSPAQARELSVFLTGLKTKINLIPFNPWPGAPFKRPAEKTIEAFRDILLDKHHTVLIRNTKGASVSAACGLLVADQTPLSPALA
ncbi:MAG: 23S rRNA (adenine(2503)-C(2))-methyltransferase RlmN [Deltaproteobacteria bacterium]|jgi:23S rRNA (adenine2503-C2)-methyltransferase|nr:23S rRNA (adenine(2503)-C(2))-methyltransferase RlmN [Deltaproteobacteria bacterium]